MGHTGLSRSDYRVWAVLGLLFAAVAAFALAELLGELEVCADCGSALYGSLCTGSGPGSCDGVLATAAVVLVILVAGCLSFAVHTMSARRLPRSGREPTVAPAPPRSGPRVAGTLALTALASGVASAVAGMLAPFFEAGVCLNDCPPAYLLGGIEARVAALGAIVAFAGFIGWVLLVRSGALSSRATGEAPGPRTPPFK